MDRRSALLFAWASMLAACGGGGGGGAVVSTPPSGASGVQPAPAPSPTPAPTPAPAPPGMSPDIVAWGDSMTPAFALNLQVLYPGRTVLQEGFLGQTSTVIANNEVADADHHNWINIFWYGHNNENDPETIKADIARSIAQLAPGNSRFIVLGVVNEANGKEGKGTPAYGKIVTLNADLAALYPGNYIDIRAWLVAHYNANDAGDVADFQDDVPPRSLRYDEIHLRNEGSVLVAERVKQFIDAKGW